MATVIDDPTRKAKRAAAHRDLMARRSRDEYAAVSEIGPLPDIVNPDRRDRCRESLWDFLITYFPASTGLKPFSDDHRGMVERFQSAILNGDRLVNAVYRGFAKTTISENAALWATLYGYRSFVLIVGVNKTASTDNIDSIKSELAENDLLAEDFPEVCHAVRQLDGKPQRGPGQTLDGQHTNIRWRADTVVFPTVDGSVSSGCIITAKPYPKARGVKHKRSDGRNARPDMAIIDDPQDEESATSPLSVRKNLKILRKGVLQTSGHSKRMAAIVNATIIAKGDMVEQLLTDASWQGVRIPMVKQWADRHKEFWLGEYASVRQTFDRTNPESKIAARKAATELYRQRQAEADAGCIVSWDHCYSENDDEISAIQHAYNILIDDGEEVFAAEYQGDPLEEYERQDALTPAILAEKLNHVPRATIPAGCEFVTAYIDVHKEILYWVASAWSQTFGGGVVDYGCWPKQTRPYFAQNDPPVPLSSTYKGTEEAAILAGLGACVEYLLGREFTREDGAAFRIGRLLIDCGYKRDLVQAFCRRHKHAAILLPGVGAAIGAKKKPFEEYRREPGMGLHCIVRAASGERHCWIDTYWYKTMAAKRLALPRGTLGGWEIFGREAREHELLFDHLTSEYATEVTANGRTVTEWEAKPNRDNHWWDCYDAETEVLTRSGWKLFSRLSPDDYCATVNLATDEIEYQKPTHIIGREYSGDMIHFGCNHRNRINLLVTPTHRMVAYAGQNSRGPVVKTASEMTIWDKVKTRASWRGDDFEWIHLDASRRHQGCDIPAHDMASFLGWYISEGSCRYSTKSGGNVQISQNQGKKRRSIVELCNRLPWRFHETNNGVVFSNYQLYEFVSVLGNSHTKRVPQWIKDSSPRIINAFLQTAVDGDGWRDRSHEAYATISRGLADDIQELYLKAGYGASISRREPQPYCIRGRCGNGTAVQYHVHRSTRRFGHLRNGNNVPNFTIVPYTGMVHCATVPNGTLVVRRHGKMAICGNCLVGSAVGGSLMGARPAGMEAKGRPANYPKPGGWFAAQRKRR